MIQVIDNDSAVIEMLKTMEVFDWFLGLVDHMPNEVNIVSWGADFDKFNRIAFLYFRNFAENENNGYISVVLMEGNEVESYAFDSAIERMLGTKVAYVTDRGIWHISGIHK